MTKPKKNRGLAKKLKTLCKKMPHGYKGACNVAADAISQVIPEGSDPEEEKDLEKMFKDHVVSAGDQVKQAGKPVKRRKK